MKEGQATPGRKTRWCSARKLRAFIVLAFLLLSATLALARAGGGGGFSDGGGGGGGFSGGGGDGGGGGHGNGFLIYVLVRLIFEYPAIGVPVAIIAVICLIAAQQQGTSAYQSSVLRRGGSIIKGEEKQAAIEKLRAHDPQFDEAAFRKRVEAAFMKIQTAWCAQNLKDVQIFLSDGVVERFSLQFAEQKAENYHDHMESITIDDLQIADVNASDIFDEISIRIDAAAIDYRQSLTDRRRVSGSTAVEPFVEIWSFLRRRGAITDTSKPGLMEGHCPNCGAAITMNQNAQCPYCRALLHSGQYDWVLSEITQYSQWESAADRPIAGLDVLRQKDPGFSIQALEDRASVIFWRKASADRIGKIDPLRKVAIDVFCENYARSFKAPRGYAGECAVGGVHMISFITADESQSMDRALVTVRWSGTWISIDPKGRRIPDNHLLQTTLLVLGRKPGVLTDADKSISSAHCPNCGAPESQSIENACAACGTVLNDGSRNWVLLQWLGVSDPAAQALLNAHRPVGLIARPPAHSAGLLAWAVKMAAADGDVDPRERALLDRFAAHDSIPPAELDRMISSALSGGLQLAEPANSAEARDWLAEIARVALSDGKLDAREIQLLKLLGSKGDMGDYDVDQLIRRVHAQQYAAARSSLRG